VKGQGAHFLVPLSHIRRSLSAILYVNETDLLHLNMNTDKSVQEVHEIRGQFGYMATSLSSQPVLDGSCNFPPDFDEATKELFTEIA
jgi:hypothetical protein